MPLTASYTDVRRDLKAITDKVMHDRVSVTVFKNNKPAFKIVPLDPVAAPAQGSRQDAVQDILDHEILRQDLSDVLDSIYDFERILTRIETGTVSPKDLVALRESLAVIPKLKEILSQTSASSI